MGAKGLEEDMKRKKQNKGIKFKSLPHVWREFQKMRWVHKDILHGEDRKTTANMRRKCA